jgi:hypothetical protein
MSGNREQDADSDGSDTELLQSPVATRKPISVWGDVCGSMYDSRYVSIFALLLALYAAYSVTLAPYQTTKASLTKEQRSLETLVSSS